jgi:hypothetical protein
MQVESVTVEVVPESETKQTALKKLSSFFKTDFKKMKISTHPEKLTRENLEKWRKEFVKKMKRTTTRTDSDRVILAVDRRQFKKDWMAGWMKVIFEDGKGKVIHKKGSSEEFEISEFERKILDQKKNQEKIEIEKSSLKQENGEWTLESSLEEISRNF